MVLISTLTLVQHIQKPFKKWSKKSGSAIGLAFDGDSDRLIAVDENGDIVDGDKIMYIIGKIPFWKRTIGPKYNRDNCYV